MFHHYHGTCLQPIQYFSTRTEVEFFGQKSTSGISLIHQKTLSPHTKLYTRTPFLYYLKISEIIYIQYRLKRTPKTKSDFSFYYFTYVELSKPNQSKLQEEDSNWPFYSSFLGLLKELLNFEKVQLSFPYNCCYYSACSTWNETKFCLAANFYMNLKWHIVTVDVKVFQLFITALEALS